MKIASEIKEEMIAEATLIVKSIEWIGEKFEIIIKDLDRIAAIDEGKRSLQDTLKLLDYEKEAISLSRKLADEDKNIDKFLKKYEKYEEEEMLRNTKKIKQSYYGSFPKKQKGA